MDNRHELAANPTEALAAITKILDILPILASVPHRGLLPAGEVPGFFKLNTDAIGEGRFSIEYAYPSGYTPGRIVDVAFTVDDSLARPIRVTRSWITITGSVIMVKTTTVDYCEAADEVTAALDWLCTD